MPHAEGSQRTRTTTTIKQEDTVDAPSIEYINMSTRNRWDLIDDLLEGTQAMRNSQEKWLHREDKEERKAFDLRLSRSFLYNALSDTLGKLTARPFARPVTLQGTLPEELIGIEDNANHQGQDLTQFARVVFRGAIKRGLHHILVDFPSTGGLQTLADEREQDIRPRFISIDAADLIGWRMAEGENNVPHLTQIRIREETVEPVGTYTDKVVRRIRVINENNFELWKWNVEEKAFKLELEGEHTFGGIPLVTVFLEPDGFMTANAPLLQLAWLNLAHYQSMSDQRNILRFSRVPILHGAGFTAEEAGAIEIGANAMITSENPDAKLTYVEHTGAAIKTGEEDLKRLEDRMEVLGLQPLIVKSSAATATGKSIDEGRTMSTIQQWVRTLENGIDQAYEVASKWVNKEIPEDFHADVFSDFQVALNTTQDGKLLLETCMAGKITVETFLLELRRRGIITEMVDPEAEAEILRSQGPALDLFMSAPDDEDDDPNTGHNTGHLDDEEDKDK